MPPVRDHFLPDSLPHYIWARREQHVKVFNAAEWGLGTLLSYVRLRCLRAGNWCSESLTTILNHLPAFYDCTVLGSTCSCCHDLE